MENGFMGEFANGKLNEVINSLRLEVINQIINKYKLSDQKITKEKYESYLSEGKELKKSKILSKQFCEQIIEIVGEPVLYNSLMELYSEAYPESKNDFIDIQIQKLNKLKG